ncbi:hypothetical protein KFE25_007166 [Diacronema lutheri]|uniref:Aminoglycoside phosphotransferase domain-containing protein n=1 Tax=Diacronema lutheri TaxID=2081491 RepID=A0A8J6CD09_DIALT|nr:hypothetical protein KFE25_007166 [Diacronema lutheri]
MACTPAEAARLLEEIDGRPAASQGVRVEALQPLWSGMGGVFLLDGRVILKKALFAPPGVGGQNPLSLARYTASYRTEARFYELHAARLLAPPVSIELPRPLRTCVHGDAEWANMLFRRDVDGRLVAQLYDFQFVGRAPPTKDVAYLLYTATDAPYGSAEERSLVAHYHAELTSVLHARGIAPPGLAAFEQSLDVASADLARFLVGWGWWARPGLAARTRKLLDELDGGTQLSASLYATALAAARPASFGRRAGRGGAA